MRNDDPVHLFIAAQRIAQASQSEPVFFRNIVGILLAEVDEPYGSELIDPGNRGKDLVDIDLPGLVARSDPAAGNRSASRDNDNIFHYSSRYSHTPIVSALSQSMVESTSHRLIDCSSPL